jgi:uncharacterized damage-inducible protein DinB
MNQLPIWFERKFEFAFPVEQHPSLCARLRATPARLEEIVQSADRDALIKTPDENGKWSAQEHAGHLADLEPLWLARIDDYINESPQLAAADLTNRKTTEARHNQRSIDDILAAFQSARGKLVARVENTDPTIFARTSLHPRMKIPMRLVDHLYFVAEHDDHHLAYIWELISAERQRTS